MRQVFFFSPFALSSLSLPLSLAGSHALRALSLCSFQGGFFNGVDPSIARYQENNPAMVVACGMSFNRWAVSTPPPTPVPWVSVSAQARPPCRHTHQYPADTHINTQFAHALGLLSRRRLSNPMPWLAHLLVQRGFRYSAN